MRVKKVFKAVAVSAVVLFGLVLSPQMAQADPIVELMRQAYDLRVRAADLRAQASAAEVAAGASEAYIDSDDYSSDPIRLNFYRKDAKVHRDEFFRIITKAQKLEAEAQIIDNQITGINVGLFDNQLFAQRLPENNKQRTDAEAEMDRMKAETQARHNRELEDARDIANGMNEYWDMAIRNAERKQRQ